MEWKKVKISAKRDNLYRKHGIAVESISRVIRVDDRDEHYQRATRRAYWHGKQVGMGIEWVIDGVVERVEYTFDDGWVAAHSRPGECERDAYMRCGIWLDRGVRAR